MKEVKLNLDGKDFNLDISELMQNSYLVKIGENEFKINVIPTSSGIILECNKEEFSITLTNIKSQNYEIFINGIKHLLKLNDVQLSCLDNNMNENKQNFFENIVTASINGIITNINCKISQKIKKGEILFSIMAMKMENKIYASQDIIIKNIYVKKDEKVVEGQKILEIEKDE